MTRYLIAVAALSLATPAISAKVVITYKGFTSNSQDFSGLVVAPGGTFDDLDFEAIYTLDDTLGVITTGPGFAEISGGTAGPLGSVNPLTASLKVGGKNFSFNSFFGHGIVRQVDGLVDEIRHDIADSTNIPNGFTINVMNHFIVGQGNNIIDSTDFTAPLSYSPNASDVKFGYFRFQTVRNGLLLVNTEASLIPTSVSIVPFNTNVVPEPANWALMIAGFGLAGVGARRKRQVRFAV